MVQPEPMAWRLARGGGDADGPTQRRSVKRHRHLHAEERSGRVSAHPPAFAPAVLPHWGGVTPFLLKSADQFQLAGPPALSSAEFAKDLNEVKTLGAKHSSTRTRDQTDAARLWIASPLVTDNDAARQLSTHKGLSVVENARLFALLNMAGADAYIACWQAKYRYNYWRPVTAIRNR